MFRFKLTIDRLVTQEELQDLIASLTFLKDGDTLSIIKEDKQTAPVVKTVTPILEEHPFTNIIPEEKPHLPTVIQVQDTTEPVIAPKKESATPKTDKLLSKAKERTRIPRAEKVNTIITTLSVEFPDYSESLDLLFTVMDWSSHKDNWRLYSVDEVSDLIVIPKGDLNKIMTRFCTLSGGDIRGFYNDYALLPKTYDELAKEEAAQRKEIEDLNREQTGDPNIGNGRKIIESRGILTEGQFLTILEKLNWDDPNKYAFLTNYELFNYFGIKEDMRNSMALIRVIKKYHPEWKLQPYTITTQYGISRLVNRFPLPKETDSDHPFPKGR